MTRTVTRFGASASMERSVSAAPPPTGSSRRCRLCSGASRVQAWQHNCSTRSLCVFRRTLLGSAALFILAQSAPRSLLQSSASFSSLLRLAAACVMLLIHSFLLASLYCSRMCSTLALAHLLEAQRNPTACSFSDLWPLRQGRQR